MSSVSNSLASSSLTGSPIQGGGKRKANKSLKAWVTFVKKVQKEEKLNYKEAIHRAKVRKDKGEKWMNGGGSITDMGEENMGMSMSDMDEDERKKAENEDIITGGRRRKSMRRRRSTRRRSTRRRR
jgi:hypothetical protein